MHGEAKRTAIPHVAALDGARGLAVAGVLLFHGGHLVGGYLGVDFFFTLSGFLITSLLLAESNRTGSVGLGGFWARRARRLLPALAVLMGGIAIFCFAFATPDNRYQIRTDALATLGYVANWREIFGHQNYFALFTDPSPLDHTWSLAIEEQFYVIWPLMFVGILTRWTRATPKAVLVITLTLACLSSALMIALYDPAKLSRAYFGTDTRAAAILFGAALAAWIAVRGPASNRRMRVSLEALGLIGVVVLAIAWSRLNGQSSTLYQGGFLLCSLSATAIIAAAVNPHPGPISRVLSWRPLCALGLISYGVYLYHWPIDVALDARQMGFGGWSLFAFQTAVTIGLAVASYRIIEQPIRRGALSSAQLRKLTPVVAVGLVAVLFASTWGAPRIITFYKRPIAAAFKAYDHAPKNARRVMFIGDSVAYYVAPAFERIKTKPPLAIFNAALQGCNIVPGVTQSKFKNAAGSVLIQPAAPCDPSWMPLAIRAFKPHVVFAMVGNASDELFYREHWIKTCTSFYASLYENSLRAEIARYGARGAHVVIVTAAYPRYIYANADRATDCDNEIRRKVAAATGTQLIDLFEYICPKGKCREKQNGAVLRPDGEHYEGRGGEIVAKWLIDQVRSTDSYP